MDKLIFGHSWEAIQRAQQGGRLHEFLDSQKTESRNYTQQDLELLEKHGIEGLKKLGLHGVLDRLTFSTG